MNWYDLMLFLPVAALIVFEARQEAGRGLLDATVTLAAVQLTACYAGWLGTTLGWPPVKGEPAPGATAVCFMAFWGPGLAFSRMLHRRTRWSMDQFDALFGVVFGLFVAVAFGHVLADFTATWATSHQGETPEYVVNSWLGHELRSFRSVQTMIDTIQKFQYRS